MHIVDMKLPRTGYGVLRKDGSYKIVWYCGSTVILSKFAMNTKHKGQKRYIVHEIKDVHDYK